MWETTHPALHGHYLVCGSRKSRHLGTYLAANDRGPEVCDRFIISYFRQQLQQEQNLKVGDVPLAQEFSGIGALIWYLCFYCCTRALASPSDTSSDTCAPSQVGRGGVGQGASLCISLSYQEGKTSSNRSRAGSSHVSLT